MNIHNLDRTHCIDCDTELDTAYNLCPNCDWKEFEGI